MKYALYPGYVISQHDGDRHYITPEMLASLYQVPMSECVINPESTEGLIVLRPRYDGNYKL